MFNCKLLERISRDVISDTLVDVSKDKTLLTLLNCPSKVISRDTILDMSSDTLTKRVMAISKLQCDVPGKSEKLLFV